LVTLAFLTTAFLSREITSQEPQTKTKSNIYEAIRSRIPQQIEANGVDGVIKLTHSSFKEELITFYECHTLAHLIGHEARAKVSDLNELANYDLDFCGSGYKHGLEAQIVAGKGDFRAELLRFCEIINKKAKVPGCFHGGGHEFMRQTLDAKKALSLCETIKVSRSEDFSECYRGVFSEYTNLIGGVDGHTGLLYADGPPLKLDSSPMDFCVTFEDKYQIECALEVNGYGVSPSSTQSSIENNLRKCVSDKYPTRIMEACLRSVAAVFGQHELAKGVTIKPPDFIFSLPLELKQAYISGTMSEFKQFSINGVGKDWESFCKSFNGEEANFCSALAS
jgi:hypothetical protein